VTHFQMDRRTMLKVGGAAAVGSALPSFGFAAALPASPQKPMRGLFPIGETPFLEGDKIDLECLANQVTFCNRGGVRGFAWPQIASGWSNLSKEERMSGAEALLAAGKGGKTAIVIGVQTKGNDLAGSVEYAKHAAKNGADAIISLPPDGDNAAVLEYYKEIGKATDLPLVVQTTGDKMPVDFVVEMFKAIPTMRVVKDEAGDPLKRITEIRQKTDDKLAVFAGNGVRVMVDELRLGFAGYCPVVSLSDVYEQAFELYEQGKHRESFDMFGRILAFGSIAHANQYLMAARGIFKDTTKFRPAPGMGSNSKQTPPTEEDKKNIREALNTYMKPYLRA
jgi:dihydrodipicolinate synthase/N-acetylneuraminate lyase